jgi:hypothetical protein
MPERIVKIRTGDSLYSLFGNAWGKVYDDPNNHVFRRYNSPDRIRSQSKIYVPDGVEVRLPDTYARFKQSIESWERLPSKEGSTTHILTGVNEYWTLFSFYVAALIRSHLGGKILLVPDFTTPQFKTPRMSRSVGQHLDFLRDQSQRDLSFCYGEDVAAPEVFWYEYGSLVQELSEIKGPVRAYLSNGYLGASGVVRHFCEQKSWPYVSFENAAPNNMILYSNRPPDYSHVNEFFEQMKNRELTHEERELLDTSLKSRFNAKRGSLGENRKKHHSLRPFQFVSADEELPSEVRRFLSTYPMIAVVFCDIESEPVNYHKDRLFSGSREWLIKTVEHFGRHPEWGLLIRSHPDQIETCGKEIDLGPLPENVFFVTSDAKINTQTLALHPSVVLYITGAGWITLDLAMLSKGRKPILVAKYCPWQDQGFLTKPKDRDDYFRKVDNFMSSGFGGYAGGKSEHYFCAVLKEYSYYPGFDRLSDPLSWPIDPSPEFFEQLK